ncbi:MAG TPA: hypothetical protein VN727_08410 [Candidatus Binatia bacterium]|nr:hypothetical protein [Candidatus Binatia bacterium]
MNASPNWASLHQAIAELTSSGNAEIHESGEWLAELAAFRWEIRYEGKNPLLHLWSDERNLTRRVLDVKEQSPFRIVLEVQRFGRSKPSRLELIRPDAQRMPARVAREKFRLALRRILERNFPDAQVESLTSAATLKDSFSDVYVRGNLSDGRKNWAVFAVRPGESAATIKNSLAYGILWLDWLRGHSTRRAIEGLRLILPEESSALICERVLGLCASARTEIYELIEREGRLRPVEPGEGNLESWLIPRSERESLLNQALAAAAGIHALAPHLPPAGDDITARIAPGGIEAALAFRGLEFARYSRAGFFFGLNDRRVPLHDGNQKVLDDLIRKLDFHRNSLAEDHKGPLYRAAPERWIETLILANPLKLDPQLDPRFLYSQVPALAQDRGIIDLLGVTRHGRLVVMELKASEDIQLPIQALDYWLRIRRHQVTGDFQRCGYFSGVELSPEPPLIWLVAPGLRFHSACEILPKYLLPEIHIMRIGLAETWRRGLKVIFRQ